MRRREFLTLFAGGAATGLAGIARSAGKRPRVGLLTLLDQGDGGGRIAAFVAGLKGLGYVDGQTIDIDYRYADGDTEKLKPLAKELVDLAPAVVYAGEPSSARAVKNAKPDLPIVCPVLTDRLPDLFASYAKPGGSVTGIASQVENLNGKLVDLALEVIPRLERLGLLVNPAGANREFVTQQVKAAAALRSLTAVIEEAREPAALALVFEQFSRERVQAVIVAPNAMLINQRNQIVTRALAADLPTLFQDREEAVDGGLLSYGVNQTETSRGAASFVDRILKGAKPGDLPIEFPTQIELVINLKTAKALGLNISRELQLRADEVIE
jgi:putative tryptophan/tyrosine transport system substrate-binding protein